MNIVILKLDENATLNKKTVSAFSDIGVIPIGVSKNNGVDYLLTRVDDKSITGNEIIKNAPLLVTDVDFVTGLRKDHLIENYITNGQVAVTVAL